MYTNSVRDIQYTRRVSMIELMEYCQNSVSGRKKSKAQYTPNGIFLGGFKFEILLDRSLPFKVSMTKVFAWHKYDMGRFGVPTWI